ncbi:helix-turn-helix domain-containing protein [Actinomadura scrupuli]|uniref:helix-turn-helix domain-containing protein n=1 Tax=Actinomadura scrupuli TaxID=559629 RepID=UPI003D99885F
MPTRTQPTVRLRRLAARLRRLRTSAGLSREDVAEHTGINPATLYRIETARGRPQSRTLIALLNLYGVEGDDRTSLVQLLKDSARKGWLQAYQDELPEEYGAYIEFEGEARSVWNYESLFVPGLLQTEDYARAVIQGGFPALGREEVARRVSVRMERQAVLTRDRPLQLWAICDEATFHRVVGGGEVMRTQVLRLVELADEPHVTLQVIPFGVGAHPGMPGSFVVMDFETDPNVVYVDSMAGDLFLEEEAEVRRYSGIYEHLRAVALSPAASVELMRRRAESLK